MLSDVEQKLLSLLNRTELEKHLDAIAAEDRLGGGTGEAQAVDYLTAVLGQAGIENKVYYHPAILSNPIACRLEYHTNAGIRPLPAKTRSFAASTGGRPVSGKLVYVPGCSLPTDILELEVTSFHPDLAGKIVLSEAAGAVAVLACARRGAAGYIQWWQGDEELVHEGIVNPVWGTPQPGEDALYPSIPVAAVSGPAGCELSRVADGETTVDLATELHETVCPIPALEAVIHPAGNNGQYLLIGNHLDSWYSGVTDNGTGNALALVLPKILQQCRDKLRFGVRVVWWSGHSNGRYAGSANYACAKFGDLAKNCLAYMNIDMPGIRGATDYSRLTVGPDLYRLASRATVDAVDVEGKLCGPVRGWDQSFQNIGVSPYLIWASALPADHPDLTNNSFMPWWWHTEQDIRDFYDPEVLAADARLYLLAAWRLLTGDGMPFDLQALIAFLQRQLALKEEKYRGMIDFAACHAALGAAARDYERRVTNRTLEIEEVLFLTRKLNQLLYVEKGSHLQDWAVEQGFVPGFEAARLLRRSDLDARQEVIIRHYLNSQVNRLLDICETFRAIIK